MADERARALRKAMTAQEVKLWSHLRGLRKSHGWHFRRQAPFGSWVLDFVCFKARLVIELDGSQHGEPAQAASDRKRDAFLQREGFVVCDFGIAMLMKNWMAFGSRSWMRCAPWKRGW